MDCRLLSLFKELLIPYMLCFSASFLNGLLKTQSIGFSRKTAAWVAGPHSREMTTYTVVLYVL